MYVKRKENLELYVRNEIVILNNFVTNLYLFNGKCKLAVMVEK